MEYQTPQFIEVEDKLIGPLTMKQFVYVAGAGGICIVLFVYFPIVLAVILSLPVVGLAGSLAFYKVNGKSFIDIAEAGFTYYTGSKLFLWKHAEMTEKERGAAAAAAAAATEAAKPAVRGTPKLTRGKLSDLAWSLDIQKTSTEDSFK